ncbi:MAG: patatin-like phospholipase family protein [Pseudomonadota bacterium]
MRSFPAPPAALADEVNPPGFSDIRFYGLGDDVEIRPEVDKVLSQIRARIAREGRKPNGGVWDALVLSGGGPDGAFGAGLLNGWTREGSRPEFGLVTGISTGALIAPFAFLGPDYDDALRRFYTQTNTSALVDFAIIKGIFGAAGLTDTTPIRSLLRREVTPGFVARLAEEHAKGRRLWVGTTNIDAQRPVIWDLGAIASSGRGDAPELIRDVMLASASIPAAFPPVMFLVEAGGTRFTEMHVDGGVTRQLFFFPLGAPIRRDISLDQRLLRRGTVYVIRNSKLRPEYEETPSGIVQIAQRSVSTLIKSGGINDIAVLEAQAAEGGLDVKKIAVPDGFEAPSEELFDIGYMTALYETGERLGLEGIPWD